MKSSDVVGPLRDLTDTEKQEASLVLAGIAAAKCNCGGNLWRTPHKPHCAALCGLRDVLEALSLKETVDGTE